MNSTVKAHRTVSTWLTLMLPLISVLLITNTFSAVVIYPGPGDLSKCDNLRQSTRYEVRVNAKSTFVYESHNTKQPDPRIMEAHFCYFSFKDEPVTIEVINLGGNISKVNVSPERMNVQTVTSGDTLKFTMQTPTKH